VLDLPTVKVTMERARDVDSHNTCAICLEDYKVRLCYCSAPGTDKPCFKKRLARLYGSFRASTTFTRHAWMNGSCATIVSAPLANKTSRFSMRKTRLVSGVTLKPGYIRPLSARSK